jgi:phage terminase small subunit
MPRHSAASLQFPNLSRVDRLQPAPELSPDERELFTGFVASVAADHFRPSDAPLLTAYCRQILLEREAAEHLAQGIVSIDNTASAWVAIQQQALKQMLQLARALKLTPTARRPAAIRAGKPQSTSYYDRMTLEGET